MIGGKCSVISTAVPGACQMTPLKLESKVERRVTLRWLRLSKQRRQIERMGEHGEAAVGRERPLFLGPIPVKLHTVVVWIAQIDGFAHAMIGGAFKFDARREHATKRVGQERAGWIENCHVIQPGGAGCGW